MTARDATAPAIVALVGYVLLHWRGMGLDPDGWAAWQAAISIVGRFVLFVPLILVPLAYLTAWPAWPRWATVALVLAMLPTIYWTASWSYRQQRESLAELGFPGNFVPPGGYISRDYRFGPNVQTNRGLLIAPSPWEETKGLKQ